MRRIALVACVCSLACYEPIRRVRRGSGPEIVERGHCVEIYRDISAVTWESPERAVFSDNGEQVVCTNGSRVNVSLTVIGSIAYVAALGAVGVIIYFFTNPPNFKG